MGVPAVTEAAEAIWQTLPRYYTYKDVLALCFQDDEDAFVDAWVAGTIPAAARNACKDTLDLKWLEILLLQRLVRQQHRVDQHLERLIAVVSEPVGGYPPEP